jgi:hypothetical protein
MDLHFLTIHVNPEPTMTPNSSPIPSSIPNEDNGIPDEDISTISDNPDEDISISDNPDEDISTISDSSSVQWWWPENQQGLEQEDRIGLHSDDQAVTLDKKGEIKLYDAIARY